MWEWAEQEAHQQCEEEEFARELADLEMKEEEEECSTHVAEDWRLQEEEQQVWEEEETRLWLASEEEKRWLMELAVQ